MEYTSLYRKFRPLRFDEIVGQEHIVKTLKNEIINDRVGHAYLFNGGRGTGKTSAAKILARAVNCLNPKDGEPCNECAICKAALEGSLTDVVEMDAASNNSVEDIRAIRDEVNFLPTLAKYRVYIIDEVHMLSTGAFNALLKTLEEPPAHVKFILATTEPQKLPATILSRCQRFDFKKLSIDNIEKRLNFVCEESKINIDKEAKRTIAVLAEGAMRDALSILERCMQEDENITEDLVKELVGIPKITSVNAIVKSIIEKNTQGALQTSWQVINEGKDINNFVWEIIKYVKDILVCKTNATLEIYSEEEKRQIKEIADKASKERLIYMIYELSNLANEIKWSSQKNIIFEVTIIKLCMQEQDNKDSSNNTESSISSKEIEDINFRIDRLAKELSFIRQNSSGKVINTNGKNVDRDIKKQENLADNMKEVKPKVSLQVGEKIGNWPKIVSQIKQDGKIMLYTNLINSTASQMNDMTVGISFEKGLNPFGKSVLERPENMSEIVRQVSIELGKPMRVVLIDENTNLSSLKTKEEQNSIAKELDLPINIIEE